MTDNNHIFFKDEYHQLKSSYSELQCLIESYHCHESIGTSCSSLLFSVNQHLEKLMDKSIEYMNDLEVQVASYRIFLSEVQPEHPSLKNELDILSSENKREFLNQCFSKHINTNLNQ